MKGAACRVVPLERDLFAPTIKLVRDYHEELLQYDPLLRAQGDAQGFYRLVFERALTEERYHVLVALDAERGEACGFASYFETEEQIYADPRRGHLSDLYVRPAARRRGIGRALLEAVLERLRAFGAQSVQLSVYASNEAGRAFWESQGFAQYMLRMRRPV